MAVKKKFDLDAYRKNIKASSKPPEPDLGCVYKIEHKKSGKIYIGITVRDPEKRWKEHGYNRKFKTCRSLINEAIQRDGKYSFKYDVIAVIPVNALIYVESNYIEYYDCLAPKGYNSVKLYESYTHGPKVSGKTRKKMSDSRIGKSPWNKGKRGVQEAWNRGQLNGKWSIPIVAINTTTGEVSEFASASQAVRDLKVNSGHVTQCCKGRLSQHKGYIFKYKTDYDQGGSNVK